MKHREFIFPRIIMARGLRALLMAVAVGLGFAPWAVAANVEAQRAEHFRKDIKPILTTFCFECHADGAKKGNVELDQFKTDAELLNDREFWFKVLKYVRSDVMPPSNKPHPNEAQKQAILDWIKVDVFLIDPARPNPGRVTVHRQNRAEYRNTIRDLMGVEFDTVGEFPADDTGFGFDNISDVLTLSPMLLEKYLAAADSIVGKSVPTVPHVMAEQSIPGSRFTVKAVEDAPGQVANGNDRPRLNNGNNNRQKTYLPLSYYNPASAAYTANVAKAGRYRLEINLTVRGDIIGASGFDANKARIALIADGSELFHAEHGWHDRREFHDEVEIDWKAGDHPLQFDLTPLTPGAKHSANLELRIDSVIIRGPVDRAQWIRPANYERFFPEKTPEDAVGRKASAKILLGDFAKRAFRRPADEASVSRLADLAESIWSAPGKTYEQGIGKAMTAILSSPRFLYREEQALPAEGGARPVDR